MSPGAVTSRKETSLATVGAAISCLALAACAADTSIGSPDDAESDLSKTTVITKADSGKTLVIYHDDGAVITAKLPADPATGKKWTVSGGADPTSETFKKGPKGTAGTTIFTWKLDTIGQIQDFFGTPNFKYGSGGGAKPLESFSVFIDLWAARSCAKRPPGFTIYSGDTITRPTGASMSLTAVIRGNQLALDSKFTMGLNVPAYKSEPPLSGSVVQHAIEGVRWELRDASDKFLYAGKNAFPLRSIEVFGPGPISQVKTGECARHYFEMTIPNDPAARAVVVYASDAKDESKTIEIGRFLFN